MEPIHVQRLLTPSRLEPVLCKQEKPLRWEAGTLKLEGGPCSDEDPAQPKINQLSKREEGLTADGLQPGAQIFNLIM